MNPKKTGIFFATGWDLVKTVSGQTNLDVFVGCFRLKCFSKAGL